MTPEQKEAYDRLHRFVGSTETGFSVNDIRVVLDALTASQPAPAADTDLRARILDVFHKNKMATDEELAIKIADMVAPSANTGQAVADAKFAIRVAFRKAIRDLPEIAPKEVQAALASVLMHDAFLAEGKRLQRLHGLGAVAPRVEQECAAGAWSFMRQGILAATHPAPLDAERVKELMPEVWEWEAAAIFMEQYDDDDTGCVRRVVKFLRAAAAHRAALRQKEGK